MKLCEAGRLNTAHHALIRANTRVPDLVLGEQVLEPGDVVEGYAR